LGDSGAAGRRGGRREKARAAAEAAQTAVVWLCGMRLHPIFILTYYLSDIP